MLYDSGATNMFRALATNAIAGSERPLARVRKVAAADSGLTAERTYLETFNMLSADGTVIYSAIISPLICPKMRKTMSVSSAHKLGELGFGHIMPRFEPNKQ